MWFPVWPSLSSRMTGAPSASACAGDVGALGDDRGDLLALEADLVGGQDGLRVARQGRHPRQVVLRHQVARHHGDHAGQRRGAARVD